MCFYKFEISWDFWTTALNFEPKILILIPSAQLKYCSSLFVPLDYISIATYKLTAKLYVL